MAESKFLRFIREDDPDCISASRWRVENKKRGDLLGKVEWYSGWREYCFGTEAEEAIFSHECLSDIAAFCLEQTRKAKK